MKFAETLKAKSAGRIEVQVAPSAQLGDDVLAANAAIVAEFRAGKDKAFNSLVGKAMAASKGKANPAQVNTILKRKLGG